MDSVWVLKYEKNKDHLLLKEGGCGHILRRSIWNDPRTNKMCFVLFNEHQNIKENTNVYLCPRQAGVFGKVTISLGKTNFVFPPRLTVKLDNAVEKEERVLYTHIHIFNPPFLFFF